MSIRVLRNWLNFIFIISALVGMLVYVKYSRETGIYIILASMIVKFTESALRMIHKND